MVETNGVELTDHEAELYDRQIRLWGLESQKRLRAARILICGLNGLGAEVAKNIILAGVKSVLLLDDHKIASKAENFSQFLVPVDDLGKNRAESSLHRARILNPTVEVNADVEKLQDKSKEFFCKFDVIFVTEAKTEEILRIDNICRENKIKFFAGDVWGMFGYGFTDLQEHEYVEDVAKHKVISKPNEKVKTEMVTSTVKNKAIFPGFEVVLNFDYKSPEYVKKIKRCGPWFALLRVLQIFRDRFNRDPHYLTNKKDVEALLEIRNEIAMDLIDDPTFTHVFNQISPVAAIVGGEIAQEIIKTVSQKEAPHKNVFLFDPETCCGFVESVE